MQACLSAAHFADFFILTVTVFDFTFLPTNLEVQLEQSVWCVCVFVCLSVRESRQ